MILAVLAAAVMTCSPHPASYPRAGVARVCLDGVERDIPDNAPRFYAPMFSTYPTEACERMQAQGYLVNCVPNGERTYGPRPCAGAGRAYTVAEIDALRQIVWQRLALRAGYGPIPAMTDVEAQVRTFMEAGCTAQNLIDSESAR